VGLLEDVEKRVRMPFRREGDVLAILGETRDELGGSEFLRVIRDRDEGPCPEVDLAAEKRLINLLATLAEEGRLASAHDLSDGGLAVALAECAMAGGLGVDVALGPGVRPSAILFGETTARAVVSFGPDQEGAVRGTAEGLGVPFGILGRVVGDRLRIVLEDRVLIGESIGSLNGIWTSAFAQAMEAADVL
jgi:phosphoribosylformylglycinamidine (FGAM) synthase-like enzyme